MFKQNYISVFCVHNKKWTPERIDGDTENKMEQQSLLQEATEDKTCGSKPLQTYADSRLLSTVAIMENNPYILEERLQPD